MTTGQGGRNLIMSFESFSPTVYICPAGKPTIGYGHRVLKGEIFNGPITKAQALDLLALDLAVAELDIGGLVKVPLNQFQFDALVCLAFNIGLGNFDSSTLLKKLNAGDYMGAADEFPRWDKAHVKGVLTQVKGLTRRRAAERALFLVK
jgi:lysozyme